MSIENRRELLNKLQIMIDERKELGIYGQLIWKESKELDILIRTVKMIEEIIYLNERYVEDIKENFRSYWDLKDSIYEDNPIELKEQIKILYQEIEILHQKCSE